jgi:hypothetical protein
MLGLAMAAALVTMALVGAAGPGSAVAKPPKLCKENTTPCPAGQQYALPQTITAELNGGEMELAGEGVPPIKCQTSNVGGKAESESEAQQQIIGQITSTTWTNCHVFTFVSCTYVALQLPWRAHLAQNPTVQGNGILSVGPNPTTHEQPGLLMECANGTKCTYKAKEVQKTAAEGGTAEEQEEKWANLAVTGGNPAIATAANVQLKQVPLGVSGCPDQAKLIVTYKVTAPKPLFISHQA